MDWGQHVSDISFRAAGTLGFLAGIWLSHLGVLGRFHTKLLYALSWGVRCLLGSTLWGSDSAGGEAEGSDSPLGLHEVAQHWWCWWYARSAAVADSVGPEGSVLSAFLPQDSLWDYVY